MSFILGEKMKMGQIWKDNNVIPVTYVKAGPIVVVQIKTKEKDGYDAVQVGFGSKKAKNIKKPQLGQFKGLGNFKYVREFRIAGEEIGKFKIGDVLDVSQFNEGDKIKASSIGKGRGFQGVVKRHGFAGGPKTHGQKNRHRAPGSIGATAPQRVMKGRRMAGHMGAERVTVINLKIAGVDKDNNILLIKGAFAGNNGILVEIKK